MKKRIKKIVMYELLWLLALVALSALAEYLIITIFDLHPVLSVKIQGIIGLLIFGYGIRMVARLLDSFKLDENEKEDKVQEGIEPKKENK